MQLVCFCQGTSDLSTLNSLRISRKAVLQPCKKKQKPKHCFRLKPTICDIKISKEHLIKPSTNQDR